MTTYRVLQVLLILSLLITAGCANNQEEELILFPKIKKAKEYFDKAQTEIKGIGDNPLEEDLAHIDKAIELNEKAIELVPESLNFQHFHAFLLERRGLYHENQSLFWHEMSRGFEHSKTLNKWVKAPKLPSAEDREKWKQLSKHHREIANEYFNGALRRLDIFDSLSGEEIPRAMKQRAEIYILMMQYEKARELYVRLSRHTRLTDVERRIANEMVIKIDKDEFYKKQRERQENYQNESEMDK